jgi:folate-binding protein YgfZ
MANRYVMLPGRAVIRVAGADARTFLQGLISQDVEQVTPGRAAYGAFLTPQGKYLHDFCLIMHGDAILLDCEAARADDLVARLSRYRLRSAVTLAADPDMAVAAVFGGPLPEGLDETAGAAMPFAGGVLFVDPRHTALGCRAILPAPHAEAMLAAAGFIPGAFDEYDALRIGLTVPDGSRDLDIDRTVLLEANFDTLNGIAWDKGCYLGQELTARTKYRGLVKRRLVTVAIDGPIPVPGTPITQDGRDVGVLHSTAGNRALATLRLDAMDDSETIPLTADGATLRLP